MILVYVTNRRIGEVRDLPFDGRVSYRNPRYWKGEVEKCSGCYVHGDFPDIEKAYGDKVISIQKESTDYTIAELRKLKPEMSKDDWKEFTKGDTRKSIDSI